MSIKRYTGTAFSDAATYKRWTGSAWTTLTTAKRWSGSAWVDLLPSSPTPTPTPTTYTYTKTLTASTDIWTYLVNTQQSSHLHEPIQGAYSGSSTARKSILIIPDLRTTLSGATIKSVRIYLTRKSDSHGETTGTVCIKTRSLTTHPTTYTAGTTANAYAQNVTLTRGQSKWITLYNSVGTGLRDGTVRSLVLDAGTNYALSRYIKYGSTIKLEIVYTK